MSDAPATPKAKSKSKLIPIVAAVLLLGGGGGGGYWWWSHRAAAEGADGKAAEAEAEHEETEPEDAGVVSFDPFVANLADDAGARFLRASIKLVVKGAERAKEIEESAVERATLQSAILDVLTQQVSDELVTPEGKEALKDEILARAGEVLHNVTVRDVLLTEFVVQF
jgi:flagellar FliL protein